MFEDFIKKKRVACFMKVAEYINIFGKEGGF